MCLQAIQSALLVMPALRHTLEGSIGIIEHLILLKEKFSNYQFSENKKMAPPLGRGNKRHPKEKLSSSKCKSRA